MSNIGEQKSPPATAGGLFGSPTVPSTSALGFAPASTSVFPTFGSSQPFSNISASNNGSNTVPAIGSSSHNASQSSSGFSFGPSSSSYVSTAAQSGAFSFGSSPFNNVNNATLPLSGRGFGFGPRPTQASNNINNTNSFLGQGNNSNGAFGTTGFGTGFGTTGTFGTFGAPSGGLLFANSQQQTCHILDSIEFSKEGSLLSYLLNEETPYTIVRSHEEDCIFTDRGIISVRVTYDGGICGARSRGVFHFNYNEFCVADIHLQIPGPDSIDLYGALKFSVGKIPLILYIRKDEWEKVMPIYRTLLRLHERQIQDFTALKLIQDAFPKVLSQSSQSSDVKELVFTVAIEAAAKFQPVSYKSIWEEHGK